MPVKMFSMLHKIWGSGVDNNEEHTCYMDSNYLKPLKVMLKSLFINNPNEEFDIYLMHSSIKEEELEDLDRFIEAEGGRLKIVQINDSYFEDAPTLLHYTKAMYYRLLAFKFLPEELDRILYLDRIS